MTLMELRKDRPHWSYSSLNQLMNVCSLQWAFERLWKIPPEGPVSGALVFGSAYHRAMEWQASARMTGDQVGASDLSDLFDTLIRRQVEQDVDVDFGEQDIDSCAAQGRKMVACYLENVDPDERVLAVNQTFCVPLVEADGGVLDRPLIGEADCVVENGKRSVVDWKTAKQRYTPDKIRTSMQPTAMLLGVSQSFGPVDDFRFDLCVKLKRAPAFESYTTTRTEDDFYRLASLAKVAEQIVAQEAFYPSECSFACASCRYKKSVCRKWHVDRNRLISVSA